MDKKSILEDGLLEQYLLGELSNEQEIQIQKVLEEDADLRKVFEGLEEEFERIGFENAISPPDSIKRNLQNALENQGEKSKLRNLSDAKTNDSFNYSRLAVAASLAAIFALSSFWFYNRWQTAEDNLEALQQQTIALQDRLSNLEQTFEVTNKRYQSINNRNVIPLLLKGNSLNPGSRAIVYVNHATQSVMVNSQGLPPLQEDKTYQMWADVDGVMIDMGLLPADTVLIPLKYIERAESLNITIEPAGGNDHPTVENLISNVLL